VNTKAPVAPSNADPEISAGPILTAAKGLDRPALTRASVLFLSAFVGLYDTVGRIGVPEKSRVKLKGVTGPITAVYETPWGSLVIGGMGPNVYAESALSKIAFLIEPGGVDLYRGRAASAIGGILRPFGAFMDASGDDVYDAGDRAFCLGGAVLGIAALVDQEGDDTYRGGDGTEGAGFFGAGFLRDGSGNDSFEGEFLPGIGRLRNGRLGLRASPVPPPVHPRSGSRIRARLREGAKPAASGSLRERHLHLRATVPRIRIDVRSGFLYDRAGNDVYRAGGRYLHRPLLPHDFQSLSQGFSIGFRPRAGGGIGVLIDESGNDFYNGEIYAQGSSYWYSIGLLCDRGGNDRYHATQYSQGAGIHLSIGSLWEWGGDDQYVSQLGVTQGTATLSNSDRREVTTLHRGRRATSASRTRSRSSSTRWERYLRHIGVGPGALTWARGFCGRDLSQPRGTMYPAKRR
jgi:hypothetical protein